MPRTLPKRTAADPVVRGALTDILTGQERQALRDICEFADVLRLGNEAWLLVPASPAVLDILAAFEADDLVEDDILDAGERDDADDEETAFENHGKGFIPSGGDDAEDDDPGEESDFGEDGGDTEAEVDAGDEDNAGWTTTPAGIGALARPPFIRGTFAVTIGGEPATVLVEAVR